MVSLKLCLIVLTLIELGENSNILIVIPFSATSHYILLRPIGLELVQRGHNVTVITSNREKDPPPNYRQIMVDDVKIWDVLGGERPNVFDMLDMSDEKFHEITLWIGATALTEVALNSTQVQHFLREDNKFDLVISEQFYQESLNILAHKYNAPLVLVSTFGNCMRHNIVTRNPLQLATVTSEFIAIKEPTSFSGRLKNLYFTIYEYFMWRYWYLQTHEDLVKKYIPNLPEPVPSLYEVQRNASLILLNSHSSFDTPAAYLPNVVEVGGLHLIKSDGKLPQDLQKIMDDAQHGVVYVNFGSNIRSSELPIAKRDAFLNVFRKLNQTVIWKWEEDNLENIPDNLFIRKWLPQKEIFAHPNTKVFISHGGLIGTQEATFHGIPIIGVPIYADQYNNLLQVQDHGFGKMLQYHDISEKYMEKLLGEVLNNPVYRNKAKELSARFRDRPMSALETAMFWIEYVIRNQGANYMKNPAINLSWVEYNMIDVYGFIIIAIIGLIFVISKFLILVINKSKRVKVDAQIKKKKL